MKFFKKFAVITGINALVAIFLTSIIDRLCIHVALLAHISYQGLFASDWFRSEPGVALLDCSGIIGFLLLVSCLNIWLFNYAITGRIFRRIRFFRSLIPSVMTTLLLWLLGAPFIILGVDLLWVSHDYFAFKFLTEFISFTPGFLLGLACLWLLLFILFFLTFEWLANSLFGIPKPLITSIKRPQKIKWFLGYAFAILCVLLVSSALNVGLVAYMHQLELKDEQLIRTTTQFWVLALVSLQFLVSGLFLTLFYRKSGRQFLEENDASPFKTYLLAGMGLIALAYCVNIQSTDTARNIDGHKLKADMQFISHRGVDDDNGVQNSLPALESTSQKAIADRVEMDVHWTKDKQWVVSHDPFIYDKDKKPHIIATSTLSELLKLSVTDNGKTAPIVSFDTYLAKAQALNMPLLVHIKTRGEYIKSQPSAEASQEARDFANRYANSLILHNDWVQVFNQSFVEQLKALAPKLKVGLLLDRATTRALDTPANFFAIGDGESVTNQFVDAVHERKKTVIAWTVNDPLIGERIYSNSLDGIISDDVSKINLDITNKLITGYAEQTFFYVIW